MATEADIPATVCETFYQLLSQRKEQGGNIAGDATNIVINKIPQEEKTQADTHNEPPTVEGDNFLGTPSIGKVHCEVSNISPDASMVAEKPDQTVKDDTEILLPSKPKLGDQPLEIAGSEEISSERIQQNAEESNDSEKGDDRGVLPVEYSTYSGEMTSGMQAGDILRDPDLDDLSVETQLSKDTTSDHHCVNDSIAKQMALSKENLQEASLLGGEKEFNIQVKATNDANGDGEKTEEDVSLNLTNDVSKEECPNDQSKMNPEQEGSDSEKKFAENLDRIAEKVGQENSTLADATSSSDEPLSKNESNSSFSQEDDTAVPTSEGSGILLENIVEESQVAVESQFRNLEGFVTTDGNRNITDEECSLVRVDGSEIQCDEQLEQESKELPVPEVLTGGTNDNESAIVDKVKDEDEDLEEAEMYELEKNKRINQQKEEAQVEKPVESLNVAPENIEASNLGQDNKTSFQEEHKTDGDQQGVTSDNSEEKTIDTVDTKKEILEKFCQEIETRDSAEEESIAANPQGILDEKTDKEKVGAAELKEEIPEKFSTIVSNEEIEGNSNVKLDNSEMKNEEHLEKESIKTSSSMPLAREANDNEPTAEQETPIEDGEKAELCENERSIENMKIELKIEKPENSLDVTSESIKASDSGQEVETRVSAKEEDLAANPQGILDEKTDREIVGAAEIKEETPESLSTSVSTPPEEGCTDAILQKATSDSMAEEMIDELDKQKEVLEVRIRVMLRTESLTIFQQLFPMSILKKNLIVKVDDSEIKSEEHLEKEGITTPSPIHLREASDDGSTVEQETQIEDGEEADLCENETNSTLPEKEDFQDTSEVCKASTSSENMETTCYLTEGSLTANLQTITSDKTIDATDAKENAAETLPHERTEGDSSIQLDCPQMKHGEHLDRECEIPPLIEAPIEETNEDKPKNTHQPNDGAEHPIKSELSENEKDAVSTSVKKEEHLEKPIDSLPVATEDIEATDSIQDIEVSSIKEQILTGAEQEISGDKTEEETIDAAETMEETADGQESEKPSSIKDFTGAANDDELTQMDEHKIEDEIQQRAEFFENERNAENTLLKEELKIEEPIESFNATVDDVKVSDLVQHTEKTGFIEEQSLVENPQGIQDYKVEEKTEAAETDEKTRELQNVLINVPNEDNDQSSLTQVDVSEMKHEEYLEKEMEISPFTEASTEDVNDDRSKIMHEAKIGVESIRKVESSEIEKNVDRTSLEKEDLQDALDASEVCKASASSENIQTTCYLEEQSLTTNLQAITSNKTIDATDAKEVTLENVAKSLSYEQAEENSTVQMDFPQMEHEEHLETESEITLVEVPTQETNEYKSKNMHDEDQIKSELSEKETVSTSAKEETNIEKPLDSLQVATKDIEVTDSSQDIEIDSTKEQTQIADPQETSGDKAVEKTTNAADTEEKIEIQDIATNVPSGVNEDDSSIKETGSQEPFLKEESTGNLNDDDSIIIDETKEEDESSTKTDLSKNEQNLDFTLAKEEVSSESSQAAEKIKASASNQERETISLEEQSLTANPQGIMGNYKEDETIHLIGTKEETPEDKNVASTLPYEDIEKSSLIQVDCSQKEHTEKLEKESDDPSVEKASTGTPQEALWWRNNWDIAANAPSGENDENSPTETDGSQKPFPTDSPKRNADSDESTLLQDAKFEDEVLSEHEKNKEAGAVNEEVQTESIQVAVLPEDIKASPLVQDRETCLLEEQNLTPNLQGSKGDQKEDKTIDATDLKEVTPEDMVKIMNIAATIPRKDTEENSQIEANCSEMEYEEHLVKESGNPSLTEALENDTEESASVKEEAQVEKLIDSLEVVSKNIKAYASNQDAEISSIKEQMLTEDPREISGDEMEEKSIDATAMNEEILKNQDLATNVPDRDNEVNSTIEVDGSQKPSIGEASTGNAHDDELKEAGASSEVENKEPEPNTELPKEIENADIKAKTTEFNEEEGYLKDIQMATAVNIAAHEELVSDLIDVKIPCTKSLDANEEMVVDIAEDPNYKQEESSITKELEEHLPISHEKVTNMTSLASEAPKLIGDYEVVAEAYSCGDKTDTEKAGELYDGSITITTNDNPVETDKKESTDTETQAATGEKEAEFIQQDPEGRTDQQDIEEDLPTKGSQDVSESNEVNTEEEKRNSDNCKEISGSTTDVALEDVSASNVASEEVPTYNPYQESRREIQQEAENEEAQKQEETVCRQEKVMSDETVEEIKVSTSTTVASDFLPISFKETTEVDHSATERELTMDKEGLHVGKAASGNFHWENFGEADILYETTDTTQSMVEDILVNNRSIGDLKEKSDDEAPKTIELTPTTTEGQELESTTVGEISILISQGEGGEYEHAPNGSVTEEKLDSNEVELGHGENRSGYEPKNEVLEFIPRVQNYDIVSEAEETRTCEENHEGHRNKKVSKVLEEPDDKATEKPEENLVTNESIDRSLLGKSIEEVTTILDAKEADGIDHVYIKTGTEDSRKEENLILSASEGKEESQTCIEAERLGFSSDTKDTTEVSRSDRDQDIPEDNENTTSENEYFEEKYANKSTESQMSAVSKDIELIEQVSKATKITSEMQETRAGSDSSVEPEATGVDSQQVEEAEETSLEAEDNLTKLHDFPQESHVMDSEVKMAQKHGPIDLQIVRDITDQDVRELNEGSIAMINKENPMELDPNENIETRCSADPIQKAPVLETLGKEMEEQQPGRTCVSVSEAKGLDCTEKKTVAHECNDLLDKSSSAVIETVSESNIHHSSAGDTAQTDKNQEGQMQIDFRPILPHTKCSDTETAENDLPVNFGGHYGTDEKELEGTPPPAKDKHVVLEADHTKNVNPENSIGNKDTSVIEHGDSAERSQGEGETLKPSDFEQGAANSGHDEMTKSRENSESKEIDKQSLADLLQVSVKETSKMADHSATEKEPTTHREDLHAEKTDEAEHEGTKTDDEEESSEQQRADVCSEAPVMVDVRDADGKVAHKKSHNILSGVGSKMKHSIAKVKKAITGKSSHSHPKPPSPK
ncbi:UNVERIFIED_CONTAM: hypothetical protein Slati_1626300 [Sesamum latifolium]|uniref:Uncharacterized protein n=1 Tax=Sesamum latifolium TaxID=2727402 RepID=A0AAW2XA90_9LAMI